VDFRPIHPITHSGDDVPRAVGSVVCHGPSSHEREEVRAIADPSAREDGPISGAENAGPLAAVDPESLVSEVRSEGPVTYVLVSSYRDNDWWGVIGAHWLSDSRQRGGFLVHPEAVWAGSEMVKNHLSARERGWTHEDIYLYWRRKGALGLGLKVEPIEEHTESLHALWEILNQY
jgi:hypothetical protein